MTPPGAGTGAEASLPADVRYVAFRALDAMAETVRALGDERVNDRPALPGANAPFAIVTHCVGVLDWWCGHLLAGRTVDRDRDAEFRATGTVEDLLARIEAAKAQLDRDLAAAGTADGPLAEPPVDYRFDDDVVLTRQRVLLHVLEELCRHHGHLDLTRDILLHG
jgi:hypothetical protein